MAVLNAIYEHSEDIPAQYRALYSEKDGRFELSGIEGVKTQADIDRISEGLRKERSDHAATKEKLRQWAGLDYGDVMAKLDKLPELEASAGKIDETKLNQIVETRLSSKLAPVVRERDQLQAQIRELAEERRVRKLHDTIREACNGKIAESAIEDALLLGERVFEEKDGRFVTRDGVGVTPGIDPATWLAEVLPKREHWLAASVGGGARGGRGGGGFANNPWSKEAWNLTAQGAYVREHGEEKAAQAAKAAGSHFGATSPK